MRQIYVQIKFLLLILSLPLSAMTPKMAVAHQEVLTQYQDIIHTKSMQRLKKVNQLGGVAYFGFGARSFNRFNHSVGVATLTAAYTTTEDPAARQKEIAAALLHDVHHGAFSHGSERWGYDHEQDGEKYARPGLEKALQKRGYILKDLTPESFPIIDQSLPDLCADRIDYNIRKGRHMGILTEGEGDYILEHLHFENGKWFFDDPKAALMFAKLATHFTKNLYTSSWNLVFYHYFGEMVKYLLKHKKLSYRLLIQGTDEDVLKVIYAHQHLPFIKTRLETCSNIYDAYQVMDATAPYDLHITMKFRGVMPKVRLKGQEAFIPLNEVKIEDAALQAKIQAFAEEYEDIREKCAKGWYLKLKIPPMDTSHKACHYRH